MSRISQEARGTCDHGTSEIPSIDLSFVRQIACDIAAELPELEGAAMYVQGYTPPSDGSGSCGYFVVTLMMDAAEVAIGICFNDGSESGDWPRSGFDAERWRRFPMNAGGSGIELTRWDEAWALVCAIGHYMRVSGVELAYGR